MGGTPETTRSGLYKLAPKIEWREQSEEEAWKEAVEAINLADWIKWLQKDEQNQELDGFTRKSIQNTSDRVLKRTQEIVENCPELASEATPAIEKADFFCAAGLEPWPEETRAVWRNIFQKTTPGSGIRGMVGFGHVPR